MANATETLIHCRDVLSTISNDYVNWKFNDQRIEFDEFAEQMFIDDLRPDTKLALNAVYEMKTGASLFITHSLYPDEKGHTVKVTPSNISDLRLNSEVAGRYDLEDAFELAFLLQFKVLETTYNMLKQHGYAGVINLDELYNMLYGPFLFRDLNEQEFLRVAGILNDPN